MMPEISVIVPVYNVEKYLSRCLNSLKSQTFQDFEVICVDDGSTDSCGEILKSFARSDHRFKVITQMNQGLSAARNHGLDVARGKYIYFLDSDDAVHPELFQICHDLAEKYAADVVSFSFEPSDGVETIPLNAPANTEKRTVKITKNPLYYLRAIGGWRIHFTVWSKFFRASVLKNHRFINGVYFEDYPYLLMLFAHHPKTVLIREKLYYYTKNMASITSQKFAPKHVSDYYIGLSATYDYYDEKASFWDKVYLNRMIFPLFLKRQLNRISAQSETEQQPLLKLFGAQLADFDKKGIIRWPFCKLKRYRAYKKIIHMSEN